MLAWILGFIFVGFLAEGQNSCLNNSCLVGSCSEPRLTNLYISQRQNVQRPPICNAPSSSSIESIYKVVNACSPVKKIKSQCVEASLKRQISDIGYYCTSPTGPASKLRGQPCVSKDMVTQITSSLNNAIACLSPPENPLDPLIALKKFNNESGFHFYLKPMAGTGVGQLTTIAVQEMLPPHAGKQQLEKILTSNNVACKEFQKLVKQDLKNPPNMTCGFLAFPEGVARNIFYSMALFLHARDTAGSSQQLSVKSMLKEKGIESSEAANYLALLTYSEAGAMGTKRFIARNLKGNMTSDEIIASAKKKTPYLRALDDKMKELIQNTPEKASIESAEECLE